MPQFDAIINLFKNQSVNILSANLQRALQFIEEDFANYLMRNNAEYSIDTIELWLSEISKVHASCFVAHCRRVQGKIALLAFDQKAVKKRLLFRRSDLSIINTQLPSSMDNALSNFLTSDYYKNLSPHTKRSYKFCLCKFLKFSVTLGINHVNDIDLQTVLKYRNEFPHYCGSLYHFTSTLPKFQNYIFYSEAITNEIYLKRLNVCACLSDEKYSGPFLANKELTQTMDEIYKTAIGLGYSPNSLIACARAKNSLGLFLETFNLDFSLELAHSWAAKIKNHFKIRMRDELFFLIKAAEVRFQGKSTAMALIYKTVAERSTEQKIPSWLEHEYSEYRRFRIENHLSKSTVSNDRFAITRFAIYADRAGCRRLSDLSPQLLKDYNRDDIHHSTLAGKQAYNIRIKNFLKYLGLRGQVPPDLWQALPTILAEKTRPVTTLSDEDLHKLLDFCNTPSTSKTPTFYRNACLVKMMLFTGLRKSDVLSLRFDELKLNTMELVKIQQKTGLAVHLPLTNAVLNALFAYLEKERPDIVSPYIFLSAVAPYAPLKRVSFHDFFLKACGVRLGTHILRRTFASMLLKKTALSAEMISIMLGHRDLASLNKYLDQNEITLQLCPISLAGIEYSGDVYDEN